MDFDKAGSKLGAFQNPVPASPTNPDPQVSKVQTGLSFSSSGIRTTAQTEDVLVAVGAIAVIWTAFVALVLILGRCCARKSVEKMEQRCLPPIVIAALDSVDDVFASCRSS